MKTYKIRKANRNNRSYSIGVPQEVAERMPESAEFEVEVTEEGVIYRPVMFQRVKTSMIMKSNNGKP